MKIPVTLFLLLLSSPVIAEEFHSWGAVEASCESKSELIKLAEEIGEIEHDLTMRIYRAAMQGYMSGINLWVREVFGKYKHLDYYSIDFAFSYLVNYCENNPKNNVVDGILEYMDQLPFIEN